MSHFERGFLLACGLMLVIYMCQVVVQLRLGYAELVAVRIELQRIANAQDRLVAQGVRK